jgi:predicted HAD superfamily Cof-like phosphohydrolase
MTYRIKTQHQINVEKFMAKAGQECPLWPTMPGDEIRLLRAKLILEEALETIHALGFYQCDPKPFVDEFFLQAARVEPCLIEVVDGCCDLKVVTTGTLSACGLPDVPFQDAIDQNNLAKFGPGSYRRDDGKWVKPPDHKAPDIGRMIVELCGL